MSKYLSYLLRHNPSSVGLALDAEGFVSLDHLTSVIRQYEEWSWVTRRDVEDIQRTDKKRRFDIVEGRIRALYGHTLPTKVHYDPVIPPELLFHGTATRNVDPILIQGIRRMKRQYVHLSSSREEAMDVGCRRDENPAIFRVFAHQAYLNGVKFYKAGSVFLSESIPPKYVQLEHE